MKKISFFITTLLAIILLASCSKDTTPELLINVYLEGSKDNNAISLYNFTDHDVSTKDYSIEIYDRREVNTPEVVISLGDHTIKAGEVFVVANSESEEEVLKYADLRSGELVFGGREHIALVKNEAKIDVLGTFDPNAENTNMRATTLVRKTEYYEVVDDDVLTGLSVSTYLGELVKASPSTTYDPYEWIFYSQDNTNYLDGFTNSVNARELLEGPKYNENSPYYNNEFVASPNVGGGGFTEVDIVSHVDGDTTRFDWKELNQDEVYGRDTGNTSLGFEASARYLDIDTPESYTGNIQEFGWVAKEYTKELQSSADVIHCQSNDGGALTEGYDRVLCYVYADEIMVNYIIILKGYSVDGFEGTDMYYKDIPYYGYFLNARLYAQRNKLGKYGETDPYWDYEANKSIYA